MRLSARALLLLGTLLIAVVGGTGPAWAPTVGQPPAPGYPPCTIVGDKSGRATNDVIHGTKRRDVICPDEGNDIVYGHGGPDVLMGGLGTDRLYGGPGKDEFHSWKGPDKLYGEKGDDHLNGEIGNDLVVGGPGKDVLLGASESDCLVALDGEGGDMVRGDKGVDRYEADPNDRIRQSAENEADCWPGN
jgi:Ca2+-binding RTX toxin-like protein